MGPRRRIALYSHDTQGLGHIRRNLAIASSLVADEVERPDILLLSGVREASALPLPKGVDSVTLPALHKGVDGGYGPRTLGATLDEVVDLRARTLTAALHAFRPDLLVVDKVARGAFGELEPALDDARIRGTQVVLGLREVLDDVETTRREWWESATTEAIDEFYDQVWVYGDPAVFDPVAEYGFPASVARKVRHTGYLSPARPVRPEERTHPYALCLVGGGQDGHALAERFLLADLPRGTQGFVVTGPFMPDAERQHLDALASTQQGRRVVGFLDDCLPLIAGAESVVAMAGYNTAVEVLALARRCLLVPRVQPRLEQLIRAERLAALGLVDVCHPADLTSAHLGGWLCRPADVPPRSNPVDLQGLARIPTLARDLLASTTAPAAAPAAPEAVRADA